MPLSAFARQSMPTVRRFAMCAASAVTLGLAGCAGSGSDLTAELIGPSSKQEQADAQVAATPQTDLEKATDYWGEKFSKSPRNLEFALNYSRNLKAMGNKQQALSVLQQSASHHGQSRELASEYGRLALELDQVQTAKQLLAFADDPSKPDWRVISARGTALAKEGNHKEAIPLYQRALALSNSNASVMNNLAMAYALDGQPAESERLLKEAASRGGSPKVQKNLALVLGLQGKYDEAQLVGNKVLPHESAKADTSLVRQMVKLDPLPMQPALAATPAVAQAPLSPQAANAPVKQATNKAATPVAQAQTQIQAQAATAPPALRATLKADSAAAGSWDSQVATAAPAKP